MGTELPATVVARCYTDVGMFTQALADCEVDGDYGTRIAETVMDIAPEVVPVYRLAQVKGRLASCRRLDGLGGCIRYQPFVGLDL